MKSDIVKPMPASAPAPQLAPGILRFHRDAETNGEPRCPQDSDGLADDQSQDDREHQTPVRLNTSSDKITPAFASAKIGSTI